MNLYQAEVPVIGQTISSKNLATLAKAFNSRILNGAGDSHWRIPYYIYSAYFIKPRLDNFSQYSPESEFFDFYQFVNPSSGDVWPIAEPQNPEGINLQTNPLNKFIFGMDYKQKENGYWIYEREDVKIGKARMNLEGLDNFRGATFPFCSTVGSTEENPNYSAFGIAANAFSNAYINGNSVNPAGHSFGGYYGTDSFVVDPNGCSAIEGDPKLKSYTFYKIDSNESVSLQGCNSSAYHYGDFNSGFTKLSIQDSYRILFDNQYHVNQNLSTIYFNREIKNHIPRLIYNYITYAKGFDFDWFFNHQYAYAPEIGQFESLRYESTLTDINGQSYETSQKLTNLRIGRKRVTFYSNPIDNESSGFLIIDSTTQNAIPIFNNSAIIYKTTKLPDGSSVETTITNTDEIISTLYGVGLLNAKVSQGNIYEKIDSFRLVLPAWNLSPVYSQFALNNIEVRAKRLKSFKVTTLIRETSSSNKAYVEENTFNYERKESNTIKSAAMKQFYAGFGYDVSFYVDNIEVDKIEQSFSVTGDTFTCVNHGLLVGDAIKFVSISSGSGINIGNGSVLYAYDVIEVNGDTFKVSTSPTGSPISATIPSTGVFYAVGYLTLEPVFLLAYKPKIQDAYALIRTCTYLNEGEADFDNARHPLKTAYKITDDLKKYGFVTNNSVSDIGGEVILNASNQAINTNPVFEASRRLSLLTRILKPDNFVRVVNSNTLEFNRYARQNISSLKLLESSGDITSQVTSVSNNLPLDNYSILYPSNPSESSNPSDYFKQGNIPGFENEAVNLVNLFGTNSGENNRAYPSCRYFELESDNKKEVNFPIRINGEDLDKVASYKDNTLRVFDPSARTVNLTELFINYDAIVIKNKSDLTAEYYYYRLEDKNGVLFTGGARKFDLTNGDPEEYDEVPINSNDNSVSIGEIGKNEIWQIYAFTRSGLSLEHSNIQNAKDINQFYFINNKNEYLENTNGLDSLLGFNYISNATLYAGPKYGLFQDSFSSIIVPPSKSIEQEHLLYLSDNNYAKDFIATYNSTSSPVFISNDKQEYVEITLTLDGVLKDLFNLIYKNFETAGVYIKTITNADNNSTNKILKTFNSGAGGDLQDASWEYPFVDRESLSIEEYNELLSGYQICFSYLESANSDLNKIEVKIQNKEIALTDRVENLKSHLLVYDDENHLVADLSESIDSYITLPALSTNYTLKARLPINLFDYQNYPLNPDDSFFKTQTFSIVASSNVFTASNNLDFLSDGVCLIFSSSHSGSSIITGFPKKYRIKNYNSSSHTFNIEQDFDYQIDSFTSTVFTSVDQHSLNNGDTIIFTNTSGLNIQSGFIYYVKNVSTYTFEISESLGGSTVTITGSLNAGIILTFSKQSSTVTGITNGSYTVRVFSEKFNPPIYLAAKTCNFCFQNPLLTELERTGNLLSTRTSVQYEASATLPKTRDIFQGIAPEILTANSGEEVSKLFIDEFYTVGGTGSITHNGQTINAGSEFKAVTNSYISNSSTVTVTKKNGIMEIAPPKDFTNEWAMWINFIPYNNVETSPLKESVYAATASPFIDRCHFRSKPLRKSVENEYLNLDQPLSLYPVMPPSYRYIPLLGVSLNGLVFENISSSSYNEQFYNSCKAFPKPYKIKEVRISESDSNNVHVVLDRNIDGWSNKENDDLTSEKSYRTDANGLRDWTEFKNKDRIRVGDTSITHDAGGQFLSPSANQMKGSYYPRFFFVKLIPEPHLDGNATRDDNDSPLLHDHLKQAELYLNAMREGFALESGTIGGSGCAPLKGHLTSPDYTYEQLIFEATSSADYYGNVYPTLSTFSSNYNAKPLRPDNPVGFGAIPQNGTYTEHYSTIAKAVNKLTRFRVSVPLSYYGRTITYHNEKINGTEIGGTWILKYVGGRNSVIGPSYQSDATTSLNPVISAEFSLRNNDGSLISISANKSSGVRFTGTYGTTTLTSSGGVWYYYISRTDAEIIIKQDTILINNAYDRISSLVSNSSLSIPMTIQSSNNISKWTDFGKTPAIDTCGVFAYPYGNGPESNTWKIEYTENVFPEYCSIQSSALIQSDSLQIYDPTTPNWGYRTCSFQVPGKPVETWPDNGQTYGGFLWTATPSAGSTKTFTVHENGFKIVAPPLIIGEEAQPFIV